MYQTIGDITNISVNFDESGKMTITEIIQDENEPNVIDVSCEVVE